MLMIIIVVEIVNMSSMACIALPQLGHEISIEHGLAHLHLLLLGGHLAGAAIVAADAEATYASLIEHVVILANMSVVTMSSMSTMSLIVHIRKHVVDTRVVG